MILQSKLSSTSTFDSLVLILNHFNGILLFSINWAPVVFDEGLKQVFNLEDIVIFCGSRNSVSNGQCWHIRTGLTFGCKLRQFHCFNPHINLYFFQSQDF